MSPRSSGCSNSGIAAYPVLNVEKRFIRSPLLDGHEANPGRGSSRRSDKSRPGVGAVLRNKVRHPRRTWSPADSVHQLALGRTRQESRIPQQEFGQRTDLAIPAFGQEALDYLLRIASFWADEVHVKKKGGAISGNLWRQPVVNVFDDKTLDGAERSLVGKGNHKYQRFFMPLLGPGRAYFRVEEISNGQSAARYHSQSEVDEYYLILDGTGTLR